MYLLSSTNIQYDILNINNKTLMYTSHVLSSKHKNNSSRIRTSILVENLHQSYNLRPRPQMVQSYQTHLPRHQRDLQQAHLRHTKINILLRYYRSQYFFLQNQKTQAHETYSGKIIAYSQIWSCLGLILTNFQLTQVCCHKRISKIFSLQQHMFQTNDKIRAGEIKTFISQSFSLEHGITILKYKPDLLLCFFIFLKSFFFDLLCC